jgi:predicted molibdopterin-dependent oxidoreductase YjgC
MDVETTCPFCPVGCGLYLCKRDGGQLGVEPSEGHPVSRGRLCARGWAAHEAPAWGARLTRPLVRRSGALVPVPWSEALSIAVAGLRTARETGRRIGVLGSARATNEENYLAAKLARAACATPHVDSALRPTYEPLVGGLAEAGAPLPRPGALDGLERCDLLLVLEGDVARTHPRVASSLLRAARSGARLVTLGAARTRFTRLAAGHVPLAPGREWQAVDALPGDGPGRTPSLAAWLGSAHRPGVVIGPLGGGAEDLRALGLALAQLLARSGHAPEQVVWLPLPARGNLRGACEVGAVPGWLPGWQPLNAEAKQRLGGVWRGELSDGHGADAARIVSESDALVLLADDPGATLPDGEAAHAALATRDFLVVLDAFETAATACAQVVLPVGALVESEGNVTSLEGRWLPVRSGLSPPGEARPGWRVLVDLIEGLGRHAPATLEALEGEMAAALPAAAPALGATAVAVGRPSAEDGGTEPKGWVLVFDGPFDWGSDPLVRFSPTLRREHLSRRRLFPRGLLELNAEDAGRIGLHGGQLAMLASDRGTAVLPAVLRAGLEPGVVRVPFGFRDHVTAVTGGAWSTEVRLTRA